MTTSRLVTLEHQYWNASPSDATGALRASLEDGAVVFLPRLRFAVDPREASLFTPALLGGAKNASFDPASDRTSGTRLAPPDEERLGAMMRRFSDAALALVGALFPAYQSQLLRRRASFRPAEIAGRATSWRKDDTRLHVDSFPANPTGGRRILRLFTNVNPDGRPRVWRIGDEFDAVARRFAPRLHLPVPGVAQLLRLVRVTKSVRTRYDALMLQLHDAMKADAAFQRESPQTTFEFPSGATWLAFTDAVPHAAMAGQFQLEQTFLLPLDAMADPERAPLRVLERIKGRRLA